MFKCFNMFIISVINFCKMRWILIVIKKFKLTSHCYLLSNLANEDQAIPGNSIPVIFRYRFSAKRSVMPETKSTTDWILPYMEESGF